MGRANEGVLGTPTKKAASRVCVGLIGFQVRLEGLAGSWYLSQVVRAKQGTFLMPSPQNKP